MGFIPPPIPTGDPDFDLQQLIKWRNSNAFYRTVAVILLQIVIAIGIVLAIMAVQR